MPAESNPDPLETVLDDQKQQHLLKYTIEQALRSLYGDKAVGLFVRFSEQMAAELRRLGVRKL